MKIGFIGTGAMGQPMVNNLITKGFSVIAYDLAPSALAAAAKLGAAAAASAAEAARAADLVITMVPSSSHAEAAYLGKDGVLEGAAAGRLCVDMSTIDPGTTCRLAEAARRRGLRFMDAPVSGGVRGATEGTRPFFPRQGKSLPSALSCGFEVKARGPGESRPGQCLSVPS